MLPSSSDFEVMSDEAWSWSPTNGNPNDKAECGFIHDGSCCSCCC